MTAVSIVLLAGAVLALAAFLLREEPISKHAPEGRVVDLSGKRVADAVIETKAVTEDDVGSVEVTTREDGTFIDAQITDPGVYDITVTAKGYCPATTRVQVYRRGWTARDVPVFVRLTPMNRVRACRPSIDVYSISADGSDVRRVTSDESSDEYFVTPSPRGGQIAYIAAARTSESPVDADGTRLWAERLVVADPDGANARSLGVVRLPSDFRPGPTWSPDGRRLAWTEGIGCDEAIQCISMEAWTVDVKTGARRRIARNAIDPAWSPDGRLIAYTWAKLYWDETGGGNPDPYYATNVFVARADGTGAHMVARNASSARWSADGERLTYVTNRRVPTTKLVSSRIDGSDRRVVGVARASRPRRSPDGQRLAWARKTALVISSAEGRSRRRIELGPHGIRVWSPVWSSDGRRLFFLVGPPGAFPCERSC